jgi:hypothetical protein
LIGRPEQLVRRAAGRPAVGHHPTGQLRTRREHDGRRDRWHRQGQQRTHLRDVAVTHPAQQLGGRQGARIETGLRVPRVRAQRLDHGDRRPRRRRRLRAPRANHATATASAELLRANRRSANGSGAPTRYLPNAAARPISASRVGPSCQDTRHAGRSHSTDTLTCASSDSTLDHTFAPSDRFILARPSVTKFSMTVT